jgi:hypothetical protein
VRAVAAKENVFYLTNAAALQGWEEVTVKFVSILYRFKI